MNTRDLIENLARDVRPVRPLPGPHALALLFVLGALPVVALVAWAFEWREDLGPHLAQAWFYAVTVLLVIASLAVSVSWFTLALPGRKGLRAHLIAAAVLGLAMVAFWLTRTPWFIVPKLGLWVDRGFQCVVCAIALALIPGIAGLWLLRRAAPVRPALAGALLGVAVGVLGTAGIGWVCDWDETAHILVAHLLLPVGILATLGALVGWKWLRW